MHAVKKLYFKFLSISDESQNVFFEKFSDGVSGVGGGGYDDGDVNQSGSNPMSKLLRK